MTAADATMQDAHQQVVATTTQREQQETFIPLNDVRKMKRTDSYGSSDIDLHAGGEENTLDFRIQAKDGSKKISLWHDVSLVHIEPQTQKETPYMNFVCEIPKFTR